MVMRKKTSQSREDLAHEIGVLAMKVFRNDTERTRERQAANAFVGAITDEVLRNKLRDRDPKKLQDAVSQVRSIENQILMEKQRARAEKIDRSHRVSCPEDDQIKALTEAINQLTVRVERKDVPDVGKTKSQKTDKQKRTFRCYHCKEPGHIRRNCPQRLAKSQIPALPAPQGN